jgi:hypothetical protein
MTERKETTIVQLVCPRDAVAPALIARTLRSGRSGCRRTFLRPPCLGAISHRIAIDGLHVMQVPSPELVRIQTVLGKETSRRHNHVITSCSENSRTHEKLLPPGGIEKPNFLSALPPELHNSGLKLSRRRVGLEGPACAY